MPGSQLGLFQGSAVARPAFDASFGRSRRTSLGDGAWFEYAQAWLSGHEALFDELLAGVCWRHEERSMYERIVEVPRLYAVLPEDGEPPPVVGQMQRALSERYGEPFSRISLGYYRDGRDSVAWHGDYVARRMTEALVATVSVGAPRRFLLRPKGGGPSIALSLGEGDLLVMGGSCQRTWDHCVPKVKRAEPRIAIMFRPLWKEA
jgi:alkylated DNA repair dioxygenase AlkB